MPISFLIWEIILITSVHGDLCNFCSTFWGVFWCRCRGCDNRLQNKQSGGERWKSRSTQGSGQGSEEEPPPGWAYLPNPKAPRWGAQERRKRGAQSWRETRGGLYSSLFFSLFLFLFACGVGVDMFLLVIV